MGGYQKEVATVFFQLKVRKKGPDQKSPSLRGGGGQSGVAVGLRKIPQKRQGKSKMAVGGKPAIMRENKEGLFRKEGIKVGGGNGCPVFTQKKPKWGKFLMEGLEEKWRESAKYIRCRVEEKKGMIAATIRRKLVDQVLPWKGLHKTRFRGGEKPFRVTYECERETGAGGGGARWMKENQTK